MAQLIVRNLEDDIRDKLRAMAQRHGRSMEEEVREILRGAVTTDVDKSPSRLGSWLMEQFAADGLDQDAIDELEKNIQELRSGPVEPPRFDGGA